MGPRRREVFKNQEPEHPQAEGRRTSSRDGRREAKGSPARRAVTALAVSATLSFVPASFTSAQEVEQVGRPRPGAPTRIPPRVVAVQPPLNATDVSPEFREISVTFDRPMTTERA